MLVLSLILTVSFQIAIIDGLEIFNNTGHKISGSYYATNPWTDDDNNNCEFLPFISLQQSPSESQYLIVKFDNKNKVPIYSIYEHNYLNDQNLLPRLNPFYDYPCERLKGQVLRDNEYTNTGWSRGHLSPQMAFRYSEEARAASNYLVNIAPQDLHSNTQPWSQIEQKLHKHLLNRRGIVITGTCSKITKNRSTRSLPVPDCYWKIVCTRDDNKHVTAAAFYHKNIMSTTTQEKEDRNGETFVVRDPKFVERLILKSSWDSLWNEAEDFLDPDYDNKPGVTFRECYNARELTSSGRVFWEKAIGKFQINFKYLYND